MNLCDARALPAGRPVADSAINDHHVVVSHPFHTGNVYGDNGLFFWFSDYKVEVRFCVSQDRGPPVLPLNQRTNAAPSFSLTHHPTPSSQPKNQTKTNTVLGLLLARPPHLPRLRRHLRPRRPRLRAPPPPRPKARALRGLLHPDDGRDRRRPRLRHRALAPPLRAPHRLVGARPPAQRAAAPVVPAAGRVFRRVPWGVQRAGLRSQGHRGRGCVAGRGVLCVC